MKRRRKAFVFVRKSRESTGMLREDRHVYGHEKWTPTLALILILAMAAPAQAGDPERGRALFALASGCGCHTPANGPVGAGGGKVPTPFGTFYGPNITPDPDTGIGRWSDEEIAAAIRDGIARGRGAESPAMPYYRYAGMSDADVGDLIAYLRRLPAVRQPNRAHEGEVPLRRWVYGAWRYLFGRRPVPAAVAPPAGLERGRYLVDHVAICGDCHTPRNWFGAPERSMYLAGTKHGPGGKAVPNITPDETGIGDWDEADIVNVLTLGMMPNMDNVQGYMADVVDGHGGGPGYKDAPPADLKSIATYLKSVAPIDNKVTDQ
jgi:mono/diheme cytochrome c family protein